MLITILQLVTAISLLVALYFTVIGLTYMRATAHYQQASAAYRADDLADGDRKKAEGDLIRDRARKMEFWRRNHD